MSLREYLNLNNETLLALIRQDESIEKALLAMAACIDNGGLIMTAGNGGSASTASHLVCDLAKGVSGNSKVLVRAVCLTDNVPLLSAWANDFSYEVALANQLGILGKKEDVFIAISGSGNSPNILRALETANSLGATSIAIVGKMGGPASKIANISIEIDSDDMQVIENIQLLICHWFFKELPLYLV